MWALWTQSVCFRVFGFGSRWLGEFIILTLVAGIMFVGITGRILMKSKAATLVISTEADSLIVIPKRGINSSDQTDTKETLQTQSQMDTQLKELSDKYVPNVKVKNISCSAIISGDGEEIRKGAKFRRIYIANTLASSSYYMKYTRNCSNFLSQRQYTMKPLSPEEASFPIAYSVLVYTNVEQVERLLRAIYRPQNYYCVHIDKKAKQTFAKAVQSIVRCLPNVFLASERVSVRWSKFSVLQPELICMRDLWRFKSWRYFINLTGQEFPLHTNGDLVKILKIMNGANIVEGKRKRRHRYRIKKPLAPSLLPTKLTQGSVHIAAQRGFVDFVLHNETALHFLEWVNNTLMPEETFFSTLSHNPHLNVPGSYLGIPESSNVESKNVIYPYLGRFVNWGESVCHGRFVRYVCVFGVGDLPILSTRKQLFLNKLYLTLQPMAFNCMEELHYNKTREQLLGLRTFDTSYYQNLDLVKNHIQ